MADKKGLKKINTFVFADGLLWSMTFFFLPIMLVNYGLSGLEIGILFSILTAMSIVSVFPIGVINDRFGTKALIVSSLFMLSVYYYFLSSVSSFWLLVPVFILGGLSTNIFGKSSMTVVLKRMNILDRGNRIGVYNLAANLGGGLGLLLGGVLLFDFNFNIVLFVTALFMLFCFIASLRLSETKKVKFPMVVYKEMFLRKKVLLLCIPLILFGMHWGAEQTSYSLFLKNVLGLDLFWSGVYMGISILMLGFFSYFSGLSIDKHGRSYKILFAGLLLSAFGHIFMVLQPAALSFVFRVIHEIGDAAAGVSYTVIFAGMFSKNAIAGNKGILDTVMVIGSIAGSIVFGVMGQTMGYSIPFVVSGIIGFISAASLFAITRKKQKTNN